MRRRKFTGFLALTVIGLTILLILSSASRRVASGAVHAIHVPDSIQANLPAVDDLHFSIPWHHAINKPPEQRNSTSGDTSWYTDWRWLSPFSSSVTLDEERAVLPPSLTRTPVYTYYDATIKRERAQKEADAALLHTWKRAWWAKGFKPIVLTQAEALSNPRYRQLQQPDVLPELEQELTGWLAWEQMGTGMLASLSCFPMASFEDPLLAHLRHGEFERLTRFTNLKSGLFAGDKTQISNVLMRALGGQSLDGIRSIEDLVDPDYFKVESAISIANYDSKTIASKYPKIAKLYENDPVLGTLETVRLIESHLHNTWQECFKDGIAVLKPLPEHTTKLVEPATQLARLLAECPESVLPSSCPPNRPRCSPCVSSKMTVQIIESARNVSSRFVVGTIPHPFTLISLNKQNISIDVAHIRRETERDAWLRSATRAFLGDGRGGSSRVVAMKDIIASERSQSRGLWFTVEHFPADFTTEPIKPKAPTNDPKPQEIIYKTFPEDWLDDLNWQLGFPIPHALRTDGQSRSPVPGMPYESTDVERPKSSYEPPPPTYEEEQTEIDILDQARKTINSKDVDLKVLRDAAEAWNLADTEVWKFARAFRARCIVERKQWEQDEDKFSDHNLPRKGRWWHRGLYL